MKRSRGQPPRAGGQTTTVNTRFSADELAALDELCVVWGRLGDTGQPASRGEVIRTALAVFSHDCQRRGMMGTRTPGDSTGSQPRAGGGAPATPRERMSG